MYGVETSPLPGDNGGTGNLFADEGLAIESGTIPALATIVVVVVEVRSRFRVPEGSQQGIPEGRELIAILPFHGEDEASPLGPLRVHDLNRNRVVHDEPVFELRSLAGGLFERSIGERPGRVPKLGLKACTEVHGSRRIEKGVTAGLPEKGPVCIREPLLEPALLQASHGTHVPERKRRLIGRRGTSGRPGGGQGVGRSGKGFGGVDGQASLPLQVTTRKSLETGLPIALGEAVFGVPPGRLGRCRDCSNAPDQQDPPHEENNGAYGAVSFAVRRPARPACPARIRSCLSVQGKRGVEPKR